MVQHRIQQRLESIKQGIIVSVQASGNEPLNRPEILCALAQSALQGGAVGVRMAQPDNLEYFKAQQPDCFIIGLTKPEPLPENARSVVYITPDCHAIAAIAECCTMVAMDATGRSRPGSQTLAELVLWSRQHYPELLLMADVSTLEEGLHASQLGFNCIGTTLSGYTEQSKAKQDNPLPDFELLTALVQQCGLPVILEGKVWEPEQVTHGFRLGAYSVVIGSAITRPQYITQRFSDAIVLG
jgi:N-acylglucosamine-6-phosphate 2-epimerase